MPRCLRRTHPLTLRHAHVLDADVCLHRFIRHPLLMSGSPFFDGLLKVNMLLLMRCALREKNPPMFMSLSERAIELGHLTVDDLRAAFGPIMIDPDFNPKMCTP